jgi:hypothetical protein
LADLIGFSRYSLAMLATRHFKAIVTIKHGFDAAAFAARHEKRDAVFAFARQAQWIGPLSRS